MCIIFTSFCLFTILILVSFVIDERRYQLEQKKLDEEVLKKPSIDYKEEAFRQDKWSRELFYK